MIKQRYVILFLAVFNSTSVFAQSQNWVWARGMGGTTNDEGRSIAVDALGNVYTTGSFEGTVDFDPGAGTFNLTGGGIFISKLNASGNFIWAKKMGGPAYAWGSDIVIDPVSGDIYITGTFVGTADFDPGAGVFNITSNGLQDIFISKLDSTGNFVWTKRMGGTHGDFASSITIDPAGNGDIYTTGSFNGTVDFDPDSGIFNLTNIGFNDQIYISKLNSSGNFVWAKAMGGGNTDYGLSIAIDGYGNVYTTGGFSGTADFDPDTSVNFNLTYAGGLADIYISKLDSAGNFIWVKAIGGVGTDDSYSAAIDDSSNVYITGYFGGTVDFNPDTGIFNLTSVGGSDLFISKFDRSGNFLWANAAGGTVDDAGRSIAIDYSDNVFITGNFAGTVDFDPGVGVFNLISNAGSQDIFISKFDSSGNFVWSKEAGGTENDISSAIAIDNSGSEYATGFFYSPAMIFGSTTLANAGNITTWDLFISKLDTGFVSGNNEIEKSSSNILLFPNPASNHFTIFLPNINKRVEVTITDITGKIIFKTTSVEGQKIEVNTHDFAEGIYLVKIQAIGYSENKKLIVTK